ncbi:aspartate aminotransferase family protein [Nodosilinea sp. LEGE 06152]|uniref:aspartate aminotransferase family protein n=1 Tax=Nodosilinea sp. LEGE 06152 TaxID=2777966 RepID=UPI001D13FF7B|nr:aspartate aminotransferase family protein [Nodosilinea sp. LEGE 06152]
MTTYGRFPIALTKGRGSFVWDDQGRRYLDFVAGIATCTLGHAHPAMVEAVSKQIQTLHHVSNLYYIPEQGALAHWLVEHSCCDRAFFCNSGAEANEGAIKLARKYAHTQRGINNPLIITAKASFHGRTLATITATGQPKYQKNFDPLMPGFAYVPYNDIAALESLVAELDAETPQVAAIMLEALQGEGGVCPGEAAYFQRIRQLCDEKGILLILDEVQVGMGRTGTLWGFENLGIEPDIFTSAKGLGGGIPIGALLCKAFCAVFEPGDHASTFGGNPFACKVGLTVCETLESENLLGNVKLRGEQLRFGLQRLVQQYPTLLDQVRGWGLINGLVLQADSTITSIDIVKAAMDEGLLLVPAGPQVVRFVPPLNVSADEVHQALMAVEKAVAMLVKRENA